jgi:phage tail-like protein
MSCPPAEPVFRLLDAYVGWDALAGWAVEGITGLEAPLGLTLAGPPASAASEAEVAGLLPHPRLARGDDCCTLFLAPRRPGPLLRRGGCEACFEPFWSGPYPDGGTAPVAVAAGQGRLAVADREQGTVWLLRQATGQLLAAIAVEEPRLLAFTPDGDLLVVSGDAAVLGFGADGLPRDAAGRPALGARIARLAVASDRSLWALVERAGFLELVVLREPDGAHACDGAAPEARAWRPATLAELAQAFAPTGTRAISSTGFCLDGEPHCWDFDGCPMPGLSDVPSAAPVRRGQLLTGWIDSGIRRCEWHRVRADASVPPGTTLELAVASAERVPLAVPAAPTPITDGEWQGFAAGIPHALDWQSESFRSGDTLDFLVDQPRGRYLFVRVRMKSDGSASPRLRRVRLDMPRVTSLAHLPGVYAEEPEAEAFTKRFLSLFDATIESFDAAIERMPALLDLDTAPAAALPWLARFFAIELDSSESGEKQRRVLRGAMELYRLRGTPAGLRHAVRLSFGDESADGLVIRELGLERPFGGLGAVELGGVRLFGRSRARFRVGTSALGATPIKSYGDPARDPIDALASRFEVSMPPLPDVARELVQERLRELVEAQKPAHTSASVSVGGGDFRVGLSSMLGIDTVIRAPAPALVGSARLGRSGTLAPSRSGTGLRLGRTAVLGTQTTLD